MCLCVCTEAEIHLGACTIVEASKPQICRVGWRPRGEATLQLKPKGRLEAEVSPSWGTSVFPSRPSTGWMRPAHIMEGRVLYSEPTDVMLSSSKKHLCSKHPDQGLSKHLGTTAQQSWHVKFTITAPLALCDKGGN